MTDSARDPGVPEADRGPGARSDHENKGLTSDGWVPSSPVNRRGDRVLVRGVPEGIERLTQQARATARVQARERVLCHLEEIPGLLEVLSEDQLERLLEAFLTTCDATAREYARALLETLPKAIGRIPTYQSVPDPRDQPAVVELPGAVGEDPLVRGGQ